MSYQHDDDDDDSFPWGRRTSSSNALGDVVHFFNWLRFPVSRSPHSLTSPHLISRLPSPSLVSPRLFISKKKFLLLLLLMPPPPPPPPPISVMWHNYVCVCVCGCHRRRPPRQMFSSSPSSTIIEMHYSNCATYRSYSLLNCAKVKI